jgi:hypothetical protein
MWLVTFAKKSLRRLRKKSINHDTQIHYHFDAWPLFNYDDGQHATRVTSTSPIDTSFCARPILPLPFVSIQSTPTADPSPSSIVTISQFYDMKYEACGAVIDRLCGNQHYLYTKVAGSDFYLDAIPKTRPCTIVGLLQHENRKYGASYSTIYTEEYS